MEIYTSGTSGISAERFFLRLKDCKVSAIIDTRLHPNSQLAGYAKQDSLEFFAKEILGITYIHEGQLCPEASDLKAYRNKEIDWERYEISYRKLLSQRDSVHKIDFSKWGDSPLILCSEETPEYCHRRIAADYLLTNLDQVKLIKHL